MTLEWRCMYSPQGMSDVYELVDADNLMSYYGTIVRQERGKGKYWYQLTVWQRGVPDYTATFTSRKKAQATGIVVARMNLTN